VIPILGLAAGVLLGLFFDPTVPLWLQPYLPIAVVAALDAVFGGFRARLDGIFDAKVFVISFVSNVVVAALIVFLGDQLASERSCPRPSSSSSVSASSATPPRSGGTCSAHERGPARVLGP
jgi:small basic protein